MLDFTRAACDDGADGVFIGEGVVDEDTLRYVGLTPLSWCFYDHLDAASWFVADGIDDSLLPRVEGWQDNMFSFTRQTLR